MIEFTLNGAPVALDVATDKPLLWAIRENLQLTGTKFGCGIAQCGACTVHLDGVAIRSCVTPVGSVAGRAVTTIEGVGQGETLHPVQSAWVAHQVPQCGYCQSGQIMSATALLAKNANPSDEEIRSAMAGNICRCGMYSRIHRAIRDVAQGESSALGAVSTWEPTAKSQEVQHG